MAIEEPAFELIEKAEPYEIRQYRPFVVAETFVDGDLDKASSAGFRLIADYIFGNNLAVGGNWGGWPNATTTFPQAYVIDYVRQYTRAW